MDLRAIKYQNFIMFIFSVPGISAAALGHLIQMSFFNLILPFDLRLDNDG